MKKCLIVINSLCGRSSKVDEERLAARFGGAYSPTVLHITDEKDEWSADGFDLVVAAGGDGTFSHALVNCSAAGVPLIYYGAGTFNECAKSKGARRGRKNEAEFVPLGKLANLSGKPFGYVAAAGSFTPLGYTSSPARKKKLGVFAYILNILREYKVYDIPATITADGKDYRGRYTLIMAIDSERCFGFRFNRLYRADDKAVHLLLIKSPGKDSFVNRVRIFFPLFRAFFVGFGKEKEGKTLVFRRAENLSVTLGGNETFNIDGDAAPMSGTFTVSVETPKNEVYIGDLSVLK